MQSRAYSVLTVKSFDEDKRILRGTATTPSPDRTGDIVEPLGVKYKNPLPLLLFHDDTKPVGRVTFDPPTSKGITFEAHIPKIADAGALQTRVDEAWQSVKSGLVAGVSIGFRSLEDGIERMKDGGLRFLKSEVLELSLVTVPANQDCTIAMIKSLDLAATGLHTPGDTGTLPIIRAVKAAPSMNTIPEQITAFENTRAAKLGRINEIQNKVSSEGRTKDEAEREESDTLKLEIKSIDAELVDLRDSERLNIVSATAIKDVSNPAAASDVRGGGAPVIQVKSNLPKGTAFTRFAMALATGKGDYMRTMERAKQWHDSTPEVELMVKAAVAAGTTTDATFAGPLVVAQPMVNEFLELLRPRTLLGRIPGLRQVPFNVSVPSQTAGGTYQWVGQGAAKPVTNAAFSTVTLSFAKAAGIIVLTEELVKLSTPSAENAVREEMIAGMGAFLDQQFIDPAIAAVANVNPASITNGAATAAASGATGAAARADLAAAVAVFTAANVPLNGSVWLMSDSNAFGLGLSLNALGQPLFPGVSQQGGTIMGMPIVVSNNVGNRIVLVHAPSILYADDGGVSIDVSREASIQMDSAPETPSTSSTVLVSLWQRNLVGLRAERYITWTRARSAAVRVITAAAYNGS